MEAEQEAEGRTCSCPRSLSKSEEWRGRSQLTRWSMPAFSMARLSRPSRGGARKPGSGSRPAPTRSRTTRAISADLKTTSETGFDLDRSVDSYRYDMQAALVKWGCKEVLGVDMDGFFLRLCRESDAPHCVDVLVLDPEDIQAAEQDLRAALRTLAYCLKTGDWFGPSGSQRDARYVSHGRMVAQQRPCPPRIS
jgi:hypothetical protein